MPPKPKQPRTESAPSPGAVGRAHKSVVAAICQSIALPVDSPSIRPRTALTAQPSIPFRLRTKVSYPIAPAGAAQSSNQDIVPNEGFFVVLRDPRCSLIIYNPNQSKAQCIQRWITDNTDVLTVAGNSITNLDLVAASTGNSHAEMQGGGWLMPYAANFVPNGTNVAFNGNRLFAAQSNKAGIPSTSWLWWNGGNAAGNQIVIAAGKDGFTGFYGFSIWAWNKGKPYMIDGVEQLTAAGYAEGATMATINSAKILAVQDYIAIHYTLYDTAAATNPQRVFLRVTTTEGGSSYYSHFCHPELEIQDQNIGSIASIGVSFLLKNMSSVQNMDGGVMACQPPRNNVWQMFTPVQNGTSDTRTSSATYDIYQVLGNYKASKEFKLITGFFGYLKANRSQDLAFRNIFTDEFSNSDAFPLVKYRGWDLDDQNFFAGAFFCNTGRTLRYEFSAGGAFSSDSQWEDPYLPETTQEDWNESETVIASAEQFFENPTHKTGIWQTIKSGLHKAIGLAPTLLAKIPEVAPFVPAIQAVSGALQSLLGVE